MESVPSLHCSMRARRQSPGLSPVPAPQLPIPITDTRRFLNGVPPSHASAAVLNGFLHVGGWRLYRAYRQQAGKLFQAALSQWLPQLAALGDPDTRADLTRIQAYFERNEWNQEPEGRALPQFDASSYDRA